MQRTLIPALKPFLSPEQIAKNMMMLKTKLRGHTTGAPNFTYGQWVGVEIECYLDREKCSDKNFVCDGEVDCSGDHECNCDLHDDRNTWIDDNYSASQLLGMSDRERARIGEAAEEAICCEESHCDCSGNEEIDCYKLERHFKIKGFKSISCSIDGSLRPKSSEFMPVEFQVNFEISNPAPLAFLCEFIKSMGGTVNSACGLHIHFDRRDKIIVGDCKKYNANEAMQNNDTITTYFNNFLPIFSAIVPDSRKDNNNQYCQKRVDNEKYSYVHLMTDTIEFRFFNGTVDFNKIIGVAGMINDAMQVYKAGGRYRKTETALHVFTVKSLEFIKLRMSMHDEGGEFNTHVDYCLELKRGKNVREVA